MNQLCKVCGEPAAGYHFGAFTCEGCKSFFGRTYSNPSTIGECKNSNQCVINKKNRTSCKSCRLKKCMAVGMSKTGSRYGRRSNWFKLHCALDSQNNQSSLTGNSNGPIQISESFNENKDLVKQIKAEANSRDLINLKSPTMNGSNNAKSNSKNSSTNSLNGNCINHTLHNITNHSNVFTSNGSARQCINTSSNNNNNNHSSPGLAPSNGQSPLETSEGLANLNLPESFSMIQTVAKALGISPFDPINSFMLQRNGEPKADLKLFNAAAAVQASSSKSNHYSQFIHPLNISSSSSSSPPLAIPGQTSRVNLSTPAIGSTMTTSLSNSSSPNVTPNGRVDTPNGNLTFPFHHHPSTTGSPLHHPGHHGLPMSPLGSTLDPSSQLAFAAQLFRKGLNRLPKEFNNINNYFLNPSYNCFLPIGPINQIAKLTSASPNLTLKSTPPLRSEMLYEQERPIDLSRKSNNKKSSSKLNKCTKQSVGSEEEDDEEEEEQEDDEDAELCLHDDNNNATRDEGSKSMIGDHDSGFSPSSNEDNIVATTPLDLTAKKSPTPPPSVAAPIPLPN